MDVEHIFLQWDVKTSYVKTIYKWLFFIVNSAKISLSISCLGFFSHIKPLAIKFVGRLGMTGYKRFIMVLMGTLLWSRVVEINVKLKV